MIPSGKVGKEFTSELLRLFSSGQPSALERITIKAAMLTPALLLQKPAQSTRQSFFL